MEKTVMTIQLASKKYISSLGMVRDVEVLVGRLNILLILVCLVALKIHFVLLYLVDISCTLLELE
jgi:hypothetical protein